MTYTLQIVAGTEKAQNLLNHLSADPNRLQKIWPETLGLSDAMQAGIDAQDYGWFLHDLENATITRLGEHQYRVDAQRLTETTPAVIEQLTQLNNRLGHPFFQAAAFLKASGQIHPVDSRRPLSAYTFETPGLDGCEVQGHG